MGTVLLWVGGLTVAGAVALRLVRPFLLSLAWRREGERVYLATARRLARRPVRIGPRQHAT